MIRQLSVILTLVIGMTSCTSHAAEDFDPANTYIISGIIGQGNILGIGKELLERSRTGENEEVKLIISSPGGEITTGMLFISLMEEAKSNGLYIKCYVPDLAASMAFSILLHCSSRDALSNAVLLWHRARVIMGGLFGTPLTGPELAYTGLELMRMDNHILREVQERVGGDPKWVRYHFEHETAHLAYDLHARSPYFITAHTSIPGLLSTLLDSTKKNKNKAGADSQDYQFPAGEIIYVQPELLEKNQ